MAMTMKARVHAPAARVAGRRVAAVQARLVSAPRVAIGSVSMAKNFADVSIDIRSMGRVSRRSSVVVQATKKSVADLGKADLEGKRVFVRADLNVPLDKVRNSCAFGFIKHVNRGLIAFALPSMFLIVAPFHIVFVLWCFGPSKRLRGGRATDNESRAPPAYVAPSLAGSL